VEAAGPGRAPYDLKASAAAAVLLSATATLAATGLALQRGYGGLPLAATALSLGLLLVPCFALGFAAPQEQLRTWLGGRRLRLVALAALTLVPYIVYGFGTGTFTRLAFTKLALFAAVPVGLAVLAREPARTLTWPDALAVLAIWLPFDFRWLEHVWPWPRGLADYILSTVLAVDLALVVFVGFRQLGDVGYRFRLGLTDLRVCAINFAAFAILAIPLGLVLGFIRFRPDTSALAFVGSAAAIWLFIALPEELLFRGIIQNLLTKTLRSDTRALLVAAVVFGAAHLNNGPVPNWRYFLLASIAGFFYGRAYRQSGGLMAAALVHTLVDATWRGFFR
jgi:hypothetical protein